MKWLACAPPFGRQDFRSFISPRAQSQALTSTLVSAAPALPQRAAGLQNRRRPMLPSRQTRLGLKKGSPSGNDERM
jgi:hypothetical protein